MTVEAKERACKKCGCMFSGVRCMPCKREYDDKYNKAHPEKQKARTSNYYKKNKEKVLAATSARRAADPIKAKQVRDAYYASNKDRCNARSSKYRKNNPEKSREYTKKWAEKNKDKFRVYAQNRRQIEKARGKLSSDIVERLFKLQNGLCACCRRALGNDFHLDHIVPLKLGGENVDGNVQLLTATCNMQKSAKHPVDFMQERGFLL